MSKTFGSVRLVGQWTAILLISLLSGELTLRAYNHFKPVYIFYDSSYQRFKGRPFAKDWDFQLNSRGYKDLEVSQERKTGQRVLGLGDSFAFGAVPYRWNYLTLLEQELKQAALDVEVVNLGIPSTGPKEYLDVLVREGLELKPDLALVSFFVGNDFADATGRRALRKWHEYSFLASLLHYAVRVRPHYVAKEIHGAGRYQDDAPTFSEEAFLRIKHQRSFVFVRDGGKFRDSLRNAVDYLDEMRQVCARRGIDFLVVIIPDELQLNPELQQALMTKSLQSRVAVEWDWAQPSRALAEECARRKIEHIDLLDAFAGPSSRQRLYKPRDTHWNIPGNELAAQAISRRLAPMLADRAGK